MKYINYAQSFIKCTFLAICCFTALVIDNPFSCNCALLALYVSLWYPCQLSCQLDRLNNISEYSTLTALVIDNPFLSNCTLLSLYVSLWYPCQLSCQFGWLSNIR